ncbi:MAG: hypothetical protein QM796_18800 [Chthoniobacteraceae bacterium]
MLLSEHDWSGATHRDGRPMLALDYLVWRLPLVRAFALYQAVAARYGCEAKGPTLVEKAMIRALREVDG